MTTIAITGASGNLGRATAEYLGRHASPESIVLVVRDPSKVQPLAARGFQVRQGDYTDVASLERAFRGVDKLLFISTSALGEERMLHHRNVVSAAQRSKVGNIAYTSVVKPSASAKFAASPGHFHTEALIRESGIPYTFFRNNLYLELVPLLFGSALQSGTLLNCAGQGRVGFVSRTDMAQAMANALGGAASLKPIYVFTTPGRPYSLEEVAASLGKAKGKTIRYVSVSAEDFRRTLVQSGVPQGAADFSAALGEAIAAGEFAESSADLQTLLGRPPTSLDAFLSASAS